MHTQEKVLLDKYDVAALLDVSTDTVQRYTREGVMPARVVLSKRKKCWLREDIMAMLHNMKEQKDETTKSNGNRKRRAAATRAVRRNGAVARRRQQA